MSDIFSKCTLKNLQYDNIYIYIYMFIVEKRMLMSVSFPSKKYASVVKTLLFFEKIIILNVHQIVVQNYKVSLQKKK